MASPAPLLAALQSMPEFMATTGQLTPAERQLIVNQALTLINDFYVHLPLKRAMHATDPVQRLRLLQLRLGTLNERKFHDEMIDIFTDLRDLHTNYVLPSPYNRKTAVLPFLLEEFFEGEQCRYVVSKVANGFNFNDVNFKPGVLLTHWNGVPVERAVELNAERGAGSNPDARHARGLESMTIRPMAMSLPPDEHWVDLTYTGDDGTPRQIHVDWKVFSPETSGGNEMVEALGEARFALGIDFLAESSRRTRKLLFAPGAVKLASQMAALMRGDLAAAGEVNVAETSKMPDVLSFRTVTTATGAKVGYIRIWTFSVEDVDAFLDEFIRILGLLPQDGLIVDVRGNGGGIIMAGERLLQLFTPKPIEAERLHFINTLATQTLANQHDMLKPWRASIQQSVETGTAFSQGFPIESDQDTNSRGQKYFGPVVLVTDARCYSTTDIFIAGFRDHQIGPILGTDGNVGAGGANVWTHELLRSLLAGTTFALKQLPKGSSMRVAIRRTTRVKENVGVPVEDLGVVPDQIHKMTRTDLFEDNKDLIARASQMLETLPVRHLVAKVTSKDLEVRLEVETKSLDRVDVFADGRPILSVDVVDGQQGVDLPRMPGALRLDGYSEGELVAARKVDL